jgi:hypothetical protein
MLITYRGCGHQKSTVEGEESPLRISLPSCCDDCDQAEIQRQARKAELEQQIAAAEQALKALKKENESL